MNTPIFSRTYPTTPGTNISVIRALETQPDKTGTLTAWLLWYLNKEVSADRSKNTRDAKTTDLQKFLNYFIRHNPEGLLSQWDAPVTNGFKEALEENGYNSSTIKRIMATLITFSRFLELKKAVDPDDNPTRKIKRSTLKTINPRPIVIKRFYDETILHEGTEAYKLLYDNAKVMFAKMACSKRDISLFSALFHTGMRVSELCSLKMSDIKDDPETGGIILAGVKRKGGEAMDSFLDATATKDLKDYLATDRQTITQQNKNSSYVFLSTKGNKLSRIAAWRIVCKFGKLYERASNKSGIEVKVEIHPHRLRHGRARLLLESGFTEGEVANELGHSDTRYVTVYTDETPNKRRRRLNEIKIE